MLNDVLISELVKNLLRNAVEAMDHADTTKRTINVSAHLNQQHFTLCIEDNGPGVPLSHQNTIFEPFFSTKEGGSGIGLSLIKTICEIHDGDIRYEAGHVGAHFCFSLNIDKFSSTQKK